MKTIQPKQIAALRELQKWQTERGVAQSNLAEAEKGLRKGFKACDEENVPAGLVNRVMLNEDGDGVGEILKKEGYQLQSDENREQYKERLRQLIAIKTDWPFNVDVMERDGEEETVISIGVGNGPGASEHFVFAEIVKECLQFLNKLHDVTLRFKYVPNMKGESIHG